MSAKEMFKELGFVEVDGFRGLMYRMDSIEKFEIIGAMSKSVFIHFVDGTVNVSKSLFMGGGTDEPIDMKLLKAINKQVEELGWNNENN